MKNKICLPMFGHLELVSRFASRYQLLLILIVLINQTSYAQVELVKDLNRFHNPDDHEYREGVEYNGLFFFATRNELWRSNGLKTGTHLVKHFKNIRSLTVFNGQLYFAADDGNGLELWKSGGASYNTKLVKDINPGTEGSAPVQFTAVGNTLYFVASTGANGTEVWKTDGTTAGTVLLRDIINKGGSSNPGHLAGVNGLLLFAANDGVNGYELWRSDGTTTGTQILKDIKPGSRLGSNPAYLTNVNNDVFFVADNGVNGRELWKTNGTESGTRLVKDIVPGTPSTFYNNLINVNGQLFFSANDRAHGEELWKSNGTLEGTLMVKDLTPGRNGSGYQGVFSHYMTNFVVINNRLYFTAYRSGNYYFWKSDGTEPGTIAFMPVEDIGITQIKAHFLTYRDNVYFVNGTQFEDNMGVSIMRESPTGEITKVTEHMLDDYYATESPIFAKAGNYLFFAARLNPEQGHSLFSSNGTSAGTRQIADVVITQNLSGNPRSFKKAGNYIYFLGPNGLWKTDGTSGGTTHAVTLDQFIVLYDYEGQFIFSAATDYNSWDIFKTDGTQEGTIPLGLEPESYPDNLTVLGQKIFYTTTITPMWVWTSSLWVTNGGVPTKLSTSSSIRIHAAASNQVFFVKNDSTTGAELWRTDGTVAGTRMVEDINPGKGSSSPNNFTVRNGVAYFTAYDAEHGYELWRSNGTSAGTYMIKDLKINDTDIELPPDVYRLTATANAVYFTTQEGIWITDGTTAGTHMLSDVRVASPLYRSNNRIYFFSRSGNYVLWKSDGTAESTVAVKELGATSFEFNHSPGYTTIGDVFYFSHGGSVLWRTDGSSCGTYQVPGTSGYPTPIEALGNTLLFGFYDPEIGRELFKLDTESITDPGCVTYASEAGIEVLDEIDSRIKTYPNPFTESFTLSIAGDANASYSAEVIDLRGNSVERKTALPFNEEHLFGRSLPSGFYILKVRERDRISTIKLIKQ